VKDLPPSPVRPTIDLEAPGVRHGHLRLPHSDDRSAWGSLMIPITVVVGGEGPTALLTGANHGDEYEGPVALFDLAHRLAREQITGRVILCPAMNYPAFRAGRRTSPIDGGNMNRAFPGRPDGTPTERVADFFTRVLLPEADLVVDLHSGGRTLEFLPFCAAHLLPDAEQQARCVAAMEAFNAPYSMILLEIDSAGMYDSAAEAQGKTFISTELGGGGTTTARSCAIARRGIANVLRHAGILAGQPEPAASVRLAMPDERCYLLSDGDGLLEPCVDLGAPVRAGQLVARVWEVTHSGRAPREYRAAIDGLLAGRHFPGLVAIGDVIAVLAVEPPEA